MAETHELFCGRLVGQLCRPNRGGGGRGRRRRGWEDSNQRNSWYEIKVCSFLADGDQRIFFSLHRKVQEILYETHCYDSDKIVYSRPECDSKSTCSVETAQKKVLMRAAGCCRSTWRNRSPGRALNCRQRNSGPLWNRRLWGILRLVNTYSRYINKHSCMYIWLYLIIYWVGSG